MSEAVKTQEPSLPQVVPESTNISVEVDKSIPEPAIEEPSTTESKPATAAPVEAISTEETPAEKPKETEKSDDLARSLFKGFQNKLAGVFPKKTEKTTSEVREETKETTAEIKEDVKDEEKETKERRSASRKRNSFFGGLVLGKKDDKSELDEAAVTDSSKDANTELSKSDEVNPEQPVASEAPVSNETTPEKPAGPFKRASIFGTLKNQFARKEKVDTTAAPKDIESSANAPVIPAVGTSDAPKEDVVTEVLVEKAQEVQTTVDAKTEKVATKAERRKSTLPFGLGLSKKEKIVSSDDEAHEKPLSPFARIRATVRSKTSPKHAPEKKEELPAPAETKTEEVTSQPLVSEPEPAVTSATPAVAASA